MDYINLFSSIEPALYSSNKSYLVTIYNSLCIFLDLIC